MSNDKTDKRNIKNNRVREAFALTAKQMIIESGVESVSVRKVADRAGYSLGTVYNHFKNLDELLWLTREMMLGDVAAFMIRQKNKEISSIDDIKAVFQLFMDYFIERPNVYRFFYNHQLSMADKPALSIMDDPAVQNEFAKTFSYLTANGRLTFEEASLRTGLIIYSILGMLTLYIAGNEDMTLLVIHSQLNAYIELLLGDNL